MTKDTTIRPDGEREVFQRVWQRVMAGREGADSLIVPLPPSDATRPRTDGDLSCRCLSAPAESRPTPAEPAESPGSDFPVGAADIPCPGESTARLRGQTLEALEAWQFYRHLAHRTRGTAARVLAALAADQHKLARRLSTAYFLRSGVRYWPSEQLGTPSITSLWGALRQRYQAEQQAQLSYRMAADDADDPTLTELYGDLIFACQSHARQLRTLLEQSCP